MEVSTASVWHQLSGMGNLPLADLKRRYANAASRFINVDGLQVHIRDEGQGPALLLLHGVLASLHTWDDWTADLKRDFRVIRVDLPGHGLTGPSLDRRYDTPRTMHLIASLLDQLQVERATLVGNSLGGYLSSHFAASHPHRVERLVVIDPAAYPMSMPPLLALAAAPGINAWVIPRVMPHWLVAHGVHQVYGDPARIRPGVVQRYFEMTQRDGNRLGFADVIAKLKSLRHDYPEHIKSIIAPTLVMWGAKDKWIPVAQAQMWQRDLSTSEVVIYDDAGHVPMEEIPERSVADFRRYMQTSQRLAA